jgi:acyl dehydratase
MKANHEFPELDLAQYGRLVGQPPRASSWIRIRQTDIDTFADLTRDRYFLHVDPDRARAESPFGGTIAHGFHTMSLLSAFAHEAVPVVRGARMGLNFGFNRVRFVAPVPVDSRVRGVFALASLTERKPGEWVAAWSATVEIEGSDKPALAGEWLTLSIF